MTVYLIIEQIINGLILGSIYALMGSGLALIFGTMRVLNFAHGEFYMLGGYFVFMLIVNYAIPPLLAIPLAMLLCFAVGALLQMTTVRRLQRQEGAMFSTIAVTLGLSVVLQNLALYVWGQNFQTIPYYLEGVVQFGEIRLSAQRILIFATSVVTLGGLALMLKYTRFGMAVRATSQDSDAASVIGVPAATIHTITFGLGAALAAVAAAMLSPVYAINPWMGVPLLLKAFIVVVLGGLGSFVGAIMGGFLLGTIETIGIMLTSSEWSGVIAFSFLILVVWLRPDGLFGVSER